VACIRNGNVADLTLWTDQSYKPSAGSSPLRGNLRGEHIALKPFPVDYIDLDLICARGGRSAQFKPEGRKAYGNKDRFAASPDSGVQKENEFKYHCKIHGKSMSGTVVVKQ